MAGFHLLFAVMPLMRFFSDCLQNRELACEMAGLDWLLAAMPLRSEVFLGPLFEKSSVDMGIDGL